MTHAVVHHTAGSNTLADWEAEVRNIWYYHTITNGWGDIGYNFLIDPNGVVYEGRAGGDGAIGAHFSCRNSNTVTECPGDVVYSMLPAMRTALCGPVIDREPQPATIHGGETATLSVTASGQVPLAYQWFSDSTLIDGATSATLTVSPLATTSYWVRVSNACGSVDSAPVNVAVESRVRRRAVA